MLMLLWSWAQLPTSLELDKGEFRDPCGSCNVLTSMVMQPSALDLMLQTQLWFPGCATHVTNLEALLQLQKQGVFPGYRKQESSVNKPISPVKPLSSSCCSSKHGDVVLHNSPCLADPEHSTCNQGSEILVSGCLKCLQVLVWTTWQATNPGLYLKAAVGRWTEQFCCLC